MDGRIRNGFQEKNYEEEIKASFERLDKWYLGEYGKGLIFEDFFYRVCDGVSIQNLEEKAEVMDKLLSEFTKSRDAQREFSQFSYLCNGYLKLLNNSKQKLEIKKNEVKRTNIGKYKQSKKKGDDISFPKKSSAPGAREKREYEGKLIEDILRADCLTGNHEAFFLNYRQLKEPGLYNIQIRDGKNAISSEEIVNRGWCEKGTGYQCIIVTGSLGAGKSILLSRVAEGILVKQHSNCTIIFISACNQSDEVKRISKKFLDCFCRKKWRKRGKFVVIIDGYDELLESNVIQNCKSIFEAARYYNATLLISCRVAAKGKIKQIENAVDQEWKTKKLSKDAEQGDVKKAKLLENISCEVLTETQESPLFRKYVEEMVEQEIENGEESAFFKNDYVYMRELYQVISTRERQKYASYKKEKECVECWLKKIAKVIHKHNGASVTLDGCIENKEKKDMYMKIAELSFFKEMISIDYSMHEPIVKGFKYHSFWKYFLMEEFYERLLGDKDELLSFLQLNWESNELDNMREGMLESIPADKKEHVRKVLEDILSINEDMRMEIERILDVL